MNVGFSTLSHIELEEVRKSFYVNRRKVIPEDLGLTPLAMAVWFMDDGSRKSNQVAASISTLKASPIRKSNFCAR